MRTIGQLLNEPDAHTFSDYLYVQGIKNQVEPERDGTWTVWILGEDDLQKARELLEKFRADPSNPEYRRMAKEAKKLKSEEEDEEQAAAKRYFDGSQVFGGYRMGWLTKSLIAISVIVWLIEQFASQNPLLAHFVNSLLISEDVYSRNLPEVRHGQIWRIITPIFMHDKSMWLHILFNMLWMKDLGSIVEYRQSSLFLGIFVLVTAAASNVAQYFISGPLFLGMSGVVYGLLGYIWMRGKFDPSSGYYLHQTTVYMMLIWLVLGYTGMLSMANTVHTVGLLTGVVWGILASQRPFSTR